MIEKSTASSPRRHIVLLDVWRIINSKGGTDKVFCDMANELVQRGYKVTALCFDKHKGEPGYKLSPQVYFKNCYSKGGFFERNPWKLLRCWAFNRTRRHVKKILFQDKVKAKSIQTVLENLEPVDLYISFEPEGTFILKSLLNTQKPVVSMYHLPIAKFLKSLGFNAFYKQAVALSEVVHVLTAEEASIARSLHRNSKVICIPNIAPQYTQTTDVKCNKKIINIARLAEQKRPELLIRAFAKIKDDYPDWTCEWWGENLFNKELSERVNKLVIELGLEGRFTFLGTTDNVVEKLNSGAIFAFPSKFEGLPLALLEAFAMGVPAVGCADCSIVKKMIVDGQSGIVTSPNPDEYALALTKLIDDPELRFRLGQQGRAYSERFSPDKIWKSWENVINELCLKNGSRSIL